MKKIILLASITLALAVFASGQIVKPTPETPQSKLEQFSARSGVVNEKQFIDVGKVRGVVLQVYRLTDLVTKTSISGLRLSYTVTSSYSSDEKIAVLDADEIDGLIKTIELLKADVFPSTRDSYTEVEYRSRGGFEAGAYYSDKKWSAYLKLEKYDSKSIVYMRPEEFDQLLSLLQTAKTSIK